MYGPTAVPDHVREARARRAERAAAVTEREWQMELVMGARQSAIVAGMTAEQAAQLFPMPARITRDGAH